MSTVFDVWMHLVFGADTKKTEKLFTIFCGSESFYKAGLSAWEMQELLTEKNIEKLKSVTLDDAKRVVAECQKEGISLTSFYEENYPEKLKNIQNKPFLLFTKGDISIMNDTLTVAMVGTRNPGSYGQNCATYISRELAQNGAVVVSGGAVGIDSLSHKGALSVGGGTVCVLGCGIAYPYLEKNRELREEISQNGVIISEYPPNFKPTKYSFVSRNRIISGLSDATLVIEAGEKSGSLVTASFAQKQKRKVLSIPGAMFSDSFKGSNTLIKEGATAVFSAEDIFAITGFTKKEPHQKAEKQEASKQFLFEKPDVPNTLSQNAVAVYNAFEEREAAAYTLQEKTGLVPSKLLGALSELELNGIITALGGGKYRFIIQK